MTVECRLRQDGEWTTGGRPVAKSWWQRSRGRSRRSTSMGECDVDPFPTAMEPLPAIQLNASNSTGFTSLRLSKPPDAMREPDHQ